MRIAVVTIFPEIFGPFVSTSLLGRAVEGGMLDLEIHDLRRFADDRHQSVDDEPYGGGAGMVMMAPPWIRAVGEIGADWSPHRVLLSPQGTRLTDAKVRDLADREGLLLLCGRYEGVDERVREAVVDEEVSIGDYVLSGGEIAAMVLIEALSRQIPGVVQRRESVEEDSFRRGLLDHPQYTRPRLVEGRSVPDVLLSGNHAAVRAWRSEQAFRATALKRPDLLRDVRLDATRRQTLEALLKDPGLTRETRDRLTEVLGRK